MRRTQLRKASACSLSQSVELEEPLLLCGNRRVELDPERHGQDSPTRTGANPSPPQPETTQAIQSALQAIILRMGKRSRGGHQPQVTAGRRKPPLSPPASIAPARSLLDTIASGELDEHLTAIADAVHARHHLLHTVRSATALAELCVGDDVRISDAISPRYLHGLRGTVIDLDDGRATVCLHRPVGRFHTGEIRCPPLALEKLTS